MPGFVRGVGNLNYASDNMVPMGKLPMEGTAIINDGMRPMKEEKGYLMSAGERPDLKRAKVKTNVSFLNPKGKR